VSPGFKRRIPFFLALAVGFVSWRSGFGFFATERTITWRLPVSHAQVQRVDLQVYELAAAEPGALLHRQELSTPSGLSSEPVTKVALTRGPHRALALVWAGAASPQAFTRDFDPVAEKELVLDFAAK
jgi:hypothetical protein